MNNRSRLASTAFAAFLSMAVLLPAAELSAGRRAQDESMVLDNGLLRAEFGDSGLASLTDQKLKKGLKFGRDRFSVRIGGKVFEPAGLGLAEIEMRPASLVYRYTADPYTFEIIYELRQGRRFLTKQIKVTTASFSPFQVESVVIWDASIDVPVKGELLLNKGSYGALCRFAPSSNSVGTAAAASTPAWSMFVMLQNPFMEWKRNGGALSVSYSPDMEWRPDYGPFPSDQLCLGLTALGGVKFPVKAVPEWRAIPDLEGQLLREPTIDAEEVEALTDCVRSFLLNVPQKSIRVHIPWCENDYQIDTATPEGLEEYKRIIDRAAELGCQYVLYTPADSRFSKLEDNSDAWGWENVLWFGLGQKIRKGEWDPRTDPFPTELQAVVDYAAGRGVKLMAYAYPSLAFPQREEWTAWTAGKKGGSRGADTGLRSFQDWWIETCLAFMRKTGAAGFSFDHWWINYDSASSRYAQWFGCRRILENLRKGSFDMVIDGRQQYQTFGPWTWLGGSYPHPTMTDEQPESFKAFPDLSTDRVSADRQRYASWVYRVERFCPPEIMPGFITHQSERNDEKDEMRRDGFRPRDWDALGWKYSLLSSIGTAPFNHVVNFIPARDTQEFKALSDDDKAFFKKWLDWTDVNARYLHRLRPIIGPPAAGRVDGTVAVIEDSGYLFLFNPNPGPKTAVFKLDASIGLTREGNYVVRELYPEEGMLIASPTGFWAMGSEFSLPLQGRGVRVLEIFAAPEKLEQPALFNAVGDVAIVGNRLSLTSVNGEPGTSRDLVIMLPRGRKVGQATVNGVAYPFTGANGVIKLNGVRFAGRLFGRSQAVGEVPADFRGGEFKGSITVPSRVAKQLADRRKSWPVKYTEDDLLAPWLGPWRLLLYAAFSEPDEKMEPVLEIDGGKVELRRAYNSVYPHSPQRTFLGFYADVSGLKPDTRHDFKLTVPEVGPGSFQGLFFEHVEPEYTTLILAPQPRKK